MSVQSDEDDEYLAMVEGQRARALATIERVKALCDGYATNSGSAYAYVVADLHAALEPTQPKGTKP